MLYYGYTYLFQLMPVGARLAEMARIRLQYDETRQQVQDIQQVHSPYLHTHFVRFNQPILFYCADPPKKEIIGKDQSIKKTLNIF